MSDLYGTDSGAIAFGNARMQQVRDLNQRIAEHNKNVADTITGLKDQVQSVAQMKEIEETAKGLWAGHGMPSKIKAYQDWRANRNGGNTKTNPTDDSTQTTTPAEGDRAPAIQGDNQAGSGEPTTADPPAEPVAEGSNTGSSVAEEEEGIGGKLTKGFSRMTGISEDALEMAGKGVGILGAGAIAGEDLYNDFKKGGWGSMNTEQKIGNIMQIGGAAADIVGTVFPPAALLGGILDISSNVVDMVGDKLKEQQQETSLDQTQQSETEQGVGQTSGPTQVTGRTE